MCSGVGLFNTSPPYWTREAGRPYKKLNWYDVYNELQYIEDEGGGTPIYKEVKLCNGSNSLLLLPPAALALYETRPADRELPPAGN